MSGHFDDMSIHTDGMSVHMDVYNGGVPCLFSYKIPVPTDDVSDHTAGISVYIDGMSFHNTKIQIKTLSSTLGGVRTHDL